MTELCIHVLTLHRWLGALDMQQNVCRPNTAEDDEYYDIPVTEKGARTPAGEIPLLDGVPLSAECDWSVGSSVHGGVKST